MIIRDFSRISDRDVAKQCWARLRRFQNVTYVADFIQELHRPPANQVQNIKKQAQQIRACLSQAEEYFNAARVVSISTKPLLLYYCVMSLSLAEILLKQDGGSSLDKARGQNAHHGLTLSVQNKYVTSNSLSDSAGALSCRPLIHANGGRFGTFELWHKSSREMPIGGKRVVYFDTGRQETVCASVFLGRDARMRLMQPAGVSLLECFESIPAMSDFLQSHKIRSKFARSTIEQNIISTQQHETIEIRIHPDPHTDISGVLDQFLFEPSSVNHIDAVEVSGGYLIKWEISAAFPQFKFTLPNAFQLKSDQVYFCSQNESLNEFGLYYVSLYILGNFARYYPDMWMSSVENSTPLALAALEFLSSAEERVPLLALSELSRTLFLVD